MRTIVGLDRLASPPGGSVVTVGTFDGVHLGHRALIARTIERARGLGAQAAALTWDRHPAETLRPERAPLLLGSQERKLELLAASGLDLLVVLPFDAELSSWPPDRFATEVLAGALGARAVVVGRDWRFGHKAAGDVDLLTTLGSALGFEVEGMGLAEAAGGPVSSSRVRTAVSTGDLDLARLLLGRPFDIDGVVVRGDARGAGLGFPTANSEIDPRLAHPPRGVYAGRAAVDGRWFLAATNLGVNPTFGGDPDSTRPRVEAYLLDFTGDLYGRTLRVEFWRRLRDERRFPSVDALVEQMRADVAATRLLVDPAVLP